MKGKKITLGYWNGLETDTKVRALKMMNLPDWMANEKMTKTDIDWEIISSIARISESPSYKLVMYGRTYIN